MIKNPIIKKNSGMEEVVKSKCSKQISVIDEHADFILRTVEGKFQLCVINGETGKLERHKFVNIVE